MSFDSRSFSVDFTESYVQTHYVLWCTVRIHYNLPSPDLRVAIVGNIPALGMWNVKQAIIARDDGNGMKSVTLNIEQGTTLLFKWIIIDKDGNVCRWEEGKDKVLHIPRIMAGACDILAPWNCDANILSVHDRYGTKCCLEEVISFANMDLDTFMNRKTTRREIVDKSIISNEANIAMNKFLHMKQVRYETANKKIFSSGSSSKNLDTILDEHQEASDTTDEEHVSRVSHYHMNKFLDKKHERLKAMNNRHITIDTKKELEKLMDGQQEQSRTMERELFSNDNIAEQRSPTRTWQQKTLQQRAWQHKIAAGIGIMSGIVIGGSAIYLASLQAFEPEPEPEADLMQTTYEYLYDMANKTYNMITDMFVDPPAVPEPTTIEQLTAAVESTYTTVVHGISSLMRSFF